MIFYIKGKPMKATKTIDRAENILRLSKSVNIY